jgi:hypothetical protein
MNKPMTDDLNAFAANDGHATETRLEAAQTDLTTNVAADRQAHNLKVVGSNPTPATKQNARSVSLLAGVLMLQIIQIHGSGVDPAQYQGNQGLLIRSQPVPACPCHMDGT